MLSRPVRALIVGLVAAAAAGGLSLTPAVERFELGTVDQRFEWRGSQGPPPDVAVVGIGPDAIGDNGGWPLPRALHARAIAALLDAGARRVAYDVQFSEPSDRPAGDRALLDAAADERVVLGTAQLATDDRPAVLGGVRRLRERGGDAGLVLFPVDADGVWRRFEARYRGVPHLAALAAGVPSAADGAAAGGPPDDGARAGDLPDDDDAAGGDRPAGDGRSDPSGSRPIDFAGPPRTVMTIPFEDVLDGSFDPADVRDRIVVVGVTDPALKDFAAVPTGQQMAGAEIQANAIQTILDDYPLRDLSPLLGVLLVLAAGLAAPLATLPGGPTRAVVQALGAGIAGAAVLVGGAQLAFEGGTIVPLAAPLLALAFGTVGAIGLTYAVELRARRRVRVAFERFVAPAVVGQILADDGDGAGGLASRRLDATVLFCDLRGFTTLAERLEAEEVIAALNRYLEAVSGAIFEHGGTVVSYQGDGVLAVFGAPLAQADHAARGLAAARSILDAALPAFNHWLLEQRLVQEPLAAGIGLNSGPVMSGSVGSSRRIEYAAVGDATNVAARLQALGRDLPGHLFVSDSTVAALGGGGAGSGGGGATGSGAPGGGGAPDGGRAADGGRESGSDAGAAPDGLRRHGAVELKGRREPVVVWVDASDAADDASG